MILEKEIIDELNSHDVNELINSGFSSDEICYFKKKILSVLMIEKMIPVLDPVIEVKDLTIKSNLDNVEFQRGVLMNKVYLFCLSLKEKILVKAEKMYKKSLSREGRITFCCDFKLLESEMISYKYYQSVV